MEKTSRTHAESTRSVVSQSTSRSHTSGSSEELREAVNNLSPENVQKSKRWTTKKQENAVDRNMCASKMTLEKIKRYFGRVDYNIIRNELPYDDPDEILSKILKHMVDTDMDMSVSNFQEFQEHMKRDIPEHIEKRSQILVDDLSSILSKVVVTSTDYRQDFYIQLLSSLKAHMVGSAMDPDFQFSKSSIVIEHLRKICGHEVSFYKSKSSTSRGNTYWRRFWYSLIGLNTGTTLLEDGAVTIDIEDHGDCESEIEIVPPKTALSKKVPADLYDSDDDHEEVITKPHAPIVIKSKPDFALFKEYAGCVPKDVKQSVLVCEVKTTLSDGQSSPQSDSDTDQFIKSRFAQTRKTSSGHSMPGIDVDVCEAAAGGQDEAITPVTKDQDQNVQDNENRTKRLEDMQKQHFIDLFGMLRQSNKYHEYRINKKIFGLYTVMNKAYITCLIPRCGKLSSVAFMLCRTSDEYHEANSQGNEAMANYFEMIALPPLNIFLPDHLKALLSFINFIIWSESKHMMLK